LPELFQQSLHDAEPFRIQRFAANWLTRPAIPVGGVALIARDPKYPIGEALPAMLVSLFFLQTDQQRRMIAL
jgi:hypothetical protein